MLKSIIIITIKRMNHFIGQQSHPVQMDKYEGQNRYEIICIAETAIKELKAYKSKYDELIDDYQQQQDEFADEVRGHCYAWSNGRYHSQGFII